MIAKPDPVFTVPSIVVVIAFPVCVPDDVPVKLTALPPGDVATSKFVEVSPVASHPGLHRHVVERNRHGCFPDP